MKALIAIVGAGIFGVSASTLGQTYMGDASCSACHSNMPETGFFDGYMRSGHPWKIMRTGGLTPGNDAWPWSPVPPLPTINGGQLEWPGVEYVIGNYFWKARFIDRDGYIYTGGDDDRTQWNLGTEEFVPYHAGEVDKPFDCGRCHTTGYEPTGNQDFLPGLVGTWAQDGVRCEACHGPASEHVMSSDPRNTPPPGGKDCSECHYRDSSFRMPWKGGFMRHHQQSEDFSHSPHAAAYDCTTCHNPHRSVVYKDGGTIKTCSECHPGEVDNGFFRVLGMEDVSCQDCHMPYMGKSGQNYNAYKGDIRGHLFQIMTDPVMAAANTYEEDGSTFWKQDVGGQSFVTLDYACLGCHTDLGDGLTIGEAASYADEIHARFAANPGDVDRNGFVAFRDLLIVLSNWGTCDLPPPDLCTGDTNFDGIVDSLDIDMIFTLWE